MTVSACITSISGPVLLPQERAFLRSASPWGVILMGRSCVSRMQVAALVDDIKSALGRNGLIFIDQEGGRVARLKPPEWPTFPAAATYGLLYRQNRDLGVEACRLGHQLMALELSHLGIHADCAPVGDLRHAVTHDAIGDRAFSHDADAVVALAGAALEGLALGGVAGCVKHMPGQGQAGVDSHYGLPRITAPQGDLEADFGVFAALSRKALMGMTGHVAYDKISSGEAATVSQTIISKIIRTRIGFDGLLMTDDLGMNALGGTLKDRGERALAAGCDVLLHCSGFIKDADLILAEMEMVAAAAGTLSGRALDRARAVDESLRAPAPFDRDAGWIRFRDLMSATQAGA